MTDLRKLAEKLEKMQKTKNNGGGIDFLQTIILLLKNNMPESAKVFCVDKGDKIEQFSDIMQILIQELFAGDQHPWLFKRGFRMSKAV